MLIPADGAPDRRRSDLRCSIASRPSATRRKTSSSCSRRWPPTARSHRLDGQRFAAGGAVGPNKPLYNYFKQLFAQVTNPPIDPIREQLVMSLVSFIGPQAQPARHQRDQPADAAGSVAAGARLRRHGEDPDIERYTGNKFRSYELDICYPVAGARGHRGAAGIAVRRGRRRRCQQGYNILIVSDRKVAAENVAIPALLALSAIHQHLVNARAAHQHRAWWSRPARRARCTTSRCWPATAPRRCIPTWRWRRWSSMGRCRAAADKAVKNFVKAIGKGLMKVMSKMGISTYMSYCGAQIFEAVGLSAGAGRQVLHRHTSKVEGIGVFEVMPKRRCACTPRPSGNDPVLAGMLDAGGEYAFRVRGESTCGRPTRSPSCSTRRARQQLRHLQGVRAADQRPDPRHMTLRGLFEFKPAGPPVPLDEVEPAAEIVKRFATGAMSLGSISTEAHTTLAVAMNRIGGKSNTGEGGEDPMRFKPITQAMKDATVGR
jgi:glutamate synthase (NADPH) large chain